MEPPLPVLLIEDDEVDQEVVKRLFQPFARSFVLTIVSDANQAVKLLSNAIKPFALIVLDLHLPVMNGLEFLAHLRQLPDYIVTPVLIFTESNHELEQLEAERYQIHAYLIKEQADSGARLTRLLRAYDPRWHR